MGRLARITGILCLFSALAAPGARAGESPFGYLYTTDTHPKGALELEQWMTLREGKARGERRPLARMNGGRRWR